MKLLNLLRTLNRVEKAKDRIQEDEEAKKHLQIAVLYLNDFIREKAMEMKH